MGRKLGILLGIRRKDIAKEVRLAADMIRSLSCEVLSDRGELCENPMLREEVIAQSDTLIVCGGDGTILSVAREAAEKHVPVLGVNFGQLGFLSEVETDGLSDAIKRLISGEYTVENRLMLEANYNGRKVYALNDIVVRRESSLSVLRADVSVDGTLLDHYVADGVLVSTPTGASAYALSCGGPLVHPSLQCLSLTAICPHSLRARPAILSPEQKIEVAMPERSLPAMICADGQDMVSVNTQDTVTIGKAPFEAQLVRISGMDFFSRVHAKLVDRTE